MHHKNRMQVLERLRLRLQPLTPEQQNDWEWFKPRWDKARIERLHPDRRCAWGSIFKNLVVDLLTKLRAGDSGALSAWMAAEAREYLAAPELLI